MNFRNLLELIWIGLMIFVSACNSKSVTDNIPAQIDSTEIKPTVNFEFGQPGYYSYAPSAIEMKDGSRYVFVCHNKQDYEIEDFIYLYETSSEEQSEWELGIEVLAPSESGWDSVHTCDPDVRKFSFTYNGEQYNWIMFYLGVDQLDSKHNQIGIAFAKDIKGPYTKYEQNPIIEYNGKSTWGVGQSTSVVLDSATVQLFYSKWPDYLMTRKINFFENGKINVGESKKVNNLSSNTYVAYSKNYRYAVRSRKSRQISEMPDMVGNIVTLKKKALSEDLISPSDKWKKVTEFGPSTTDFPRNHNPGILTNPEGYIENEDKVTVYFTVAEVGPNWLWSYDMYSVEIES